MSHDTPHFDDSASEREWLVQEDALRAERLGLDPYRNDARARRYRLIARTLRQPPIEALPEDFAQRVAALAMRHSAPVETPRERRLEATLFACVVGIFVIAGAATANFYHQDWLPAIRIAMPTLSPQALRWSLVLAGCLGFSWLLGKLKPRTPASSLT